MLKFTIRRSLYGSGEKPSLYPRFSVAELFLRKVLRLLTASAG